MKIFSQYYDITAFILVNGILYVKVSLSSELVAVNTSVILLQKPLSTADTTPAARHYHSAYHVSEYACSTVI